MLEQQLASLGSQDLFSPRKLLKTPKSFASCRLSLSVITILEKSLNSVLIHLKSSLQTPHTLCQMSTRCPWDLCLSPSRATGTLQMWRWSRAGKLPWNVRVAPCAHESLYKMEMGGPGSETGGVRLGAEAGAPVLSDGGRPPAEDAGPLEAGRQDRCRPGASGRRHGPQTSEAGTAPNKCA